jgi:hypothetical protein
MFLAFPLKNDAIPHKPNLPKGSTVDQQPEPFRDQGQPFHWFSKNSVTLVDVTIGEAAFK